MVSGDSESLRVEYPAARSGPLLDLSWGWEPHWTYSDVISTARKLIRMRQPAKTQMWQQWVVSR